MQKPTFPRGPFPYGPLISFPIVVEGVETDIETNGEPASEPNGEPNDEAFRRIAQLLYIASD